ncbi:MAG TPA: TIGR04282 family arsenosugar biosynthesis glycosyltransferase [Candidatus Acidoferrales bacterium]|nr:TIGR04282 family arsenosugar biosynthesis glycosyltransferase [Candidatus Acidoferrales bacterium]
MGSEPKSVARALAVMAKAPLEGFVKTRLSPCLSLADAAGFYECLLADIIAKFQKHNGAELWIAVAPGGEGYFSQNYPGANRLPQRGNDLGERLHHVFVDLFERGYGEILVVDSDSPAVPPATIDQAYRKLSEEGCDLVLGPCEDGGYYLIGLKRPMEPLFHDIRWSTDAVLETTLARARAAKLRAGLLPPTYDIDEEEDLRRLWDHFTIAPEVRELAPRTYNYLRNRTAAGSSPVWLSASDEAKEVRNDRS